jgi:hypothetical protein
MEAAQRHGIEIDYCPECRGIWLDRGELDKIIQRSQPAMPLRDDDDEYEDKPKRGYAPADYRPAEYRERYRDDDDYDDRYDRRKKRARWFDDIFDIFD